MRRSLPTAVLLIVAAVLVQACTTSETLGTATAPADSSQTAEGTTPLPPPSTQAEATETAALPPPEGSTPAGSTLAGSAAAGTVADNPAAPEAQTFTQAGSMARVQLAPVVGTSIAAATPLSQRLEASGRGKGIDFRGEGAQRLSYVLKGYFSLETGARAGNIIYVWDVLDTAGNRLHRISGQQAVQGRVSPDWSGVPASAMEALADRTVDELAAWLRTRSG